MSPGPRTPGRGRGLAALASLAALTILEQLSRRGRFAMSPSTSQSVSSSSPGSGPSRPATAAPRETGAGTTPARRHGDTAPGEQREGGDVGASVRTYLIGLALAAVLTAGSFALSYTKLVYGPGVGVALVVFALAQVGIHLIFFLHLTTAPDNINNAMALAFGTLIVVLLIGGTLWIMMHMNQNMMNMPMHGMAHPMPGAGTRP